MSMEILSGQKLRANPAGRSRRIAFATATLILLLLSAFCASAQTSTSRKKGVPNYAELAHAPQKAGARLNPLEKDPDAVAAGTKLFDLHCAQCHGSNANGSRRGPSLRAQEVQRAAPGTLFWLLTNGVVRRGMPVWSKLPEPQRWQIVSYIKSLEPRAIPAAP
jgi:mono/diheme cytochrome c family protein